VKEETEHSINKSLYRWKCSRAEAESLLH